jgi:hypothetical protein
VLLIPDTANRTQLIENLAAGAVSLRDDEVVSLTQQFG